jgi:hypothetical protein
MNAGLESQGFAGNTRVLIDGLREKLKTVAEPAE